MVASFDKHSYGLSRQIRESDFLDGPGSNELDSHCIENAVFHRIYAVVHIT